MPCASSRSSSSASCSCAAASRRSDASPRRRAGDLVACQPQADGERDETLLGPVVEVPLEPPALAVCCLREARARGAELLRDALPLGDDGGEPDGRERCDRDEELGAQEASLSRGRGERAVVVHGVPDRESDHDRDAQARPALAEAECGPDQRAEGEIGPRALVARRELAHGEDGSDQERSLELAPLDGELPWRPPRERERHDDQGAREVAEPPCPHDMGQFIGGQHPACEQRERPDGGADRRAGGQRDEHPEDAPCTVERRPSAHEAVKQPRSDEHLEHVAAGLADRGAERHRGVLVREQVAQDESGPETGTAEIHECDPDSRGQPHDAADRPGELECIAELGGPVVGRRQDQGAGDGGVANPEAAAEARRERARDGAAAQKCRGGSTLANQATPFPWQPPNRPPVRIRVLRISGNACACARSRRSPRRAQLGGGSPFVCEARDRAGGFDGCGPSKCAEEWHMAADRQPNILVIWGDDIGISNLSCYSEGLMGYWTPNIDRIAERGHELHRLLRRAELHRRDARRSSRARASSAPA